MALDDFITKSLDTLENYEHAKHIFYSPWDSLDSDIEFASFHDKQVPTYLNRREWAEGV